MLSQPHHLDTLQALIAGREDLISRLAAPLWARVGQTLDPELLWARTILGEKGPGILVSCLSHFEAFDTRTKAVNAQGLNRFLGFLLGQRDDISHFTKPPELVWTLPNSHPAYSVRGSSYLRSCISLINEAEETLSLVSPFIDPGGIGTLLSPINVALARGVSVKLFTHDALNLATPTSRALEQLRREAGRSRSNLSVYSAAEAGTGRDRLLNPLFHAKLVVCDERSALIGSANLTSHALGGNFEAGVLLGEAAAKEAILILDGILRSKTVYLVFDTR
jgi:phosphatidylserine/phosphatidylglycerophosphate/cardiolipin synthase-like enzyme